MNTRLLLRVLALAGALLTAAPGARGDPVMDWNEVAFKAVVTARQSPPQRLLNRSSAFFTTRWSYLRR